MGGRAYAEDGGWHGEETRRVLCHAENFLMVRLGPEKCDGVSHAELCCHGTQYPASTDVGTLLEGEPLVRHERRSGKR